MDSNPVIATLGRRIRLAVIGGGPGSFIGAMHRTAARLDDRYELVAAALSSNPERSVVAGADLGLDQDRCYADGLDLIAAEATREDGADVVAIMTPNDTHHLFSTAAIAAGFHVISDKPLTNTLDEARDVLEQSQSSGLVFALTHNYTGYPMIRQAKAMVEAGELGDIKLIQVHYVQGHMANDPEPSEDGSVPWRYDPIKGGPSLVMGDIGTHAHNIVTFISGHEVTEVSAMVGTVMPKLTVHDHAAAMLKFDNGARGTFWVTQAAAGVENDLTVRISGTKGSIEWKQEVAQQLWFKPIDGPAQLRTPNGPGTYPISARASRIVAGHPEGFHEGFANVYSDAAEAIAAHISNTQANPDSMYFPNVVDGYNGVAFVAAVMASDTNGGAWTKV